MLSTYKPSKNNRVTFCDGTIQGVEIRKGHITANATPKIPAGKKTVSYKRFYRNSTNDIRCDLVLTIPFEAPIFEDMHIEFFDFRKAKKGKIYRVIQMLEKPDSAPPCIEIDLTQMKTKFDDDREDGMHEVS